MQRGSGGILFHRSPHYIQPGHGIGSIFKSLARFILPAAKKTFKTVANVGKQIIANPIVRDLANTVKDEIIRTGVNAAANLIQGNEIAPEFQSNVDEARVKVANKVREKVLGSGRKKKSAILLEEFEPKRKRHKLPLDIFSLAE
jgi:hypothetical protein